jgi:hypothetical protein
MEQRPRFDRAAGGDAVNNMIVDHDVAYEQGTYPSKPLQVIVFPLALHRGCRSLLKVKSSEGVQSWVPMLIGIAATGFSVHPSCFETSVCAIGCMGKVPKEGQAEAGICLKACARNAVPCG